MRPIRQTIPLDEARAIIERSLVPLNRTEHVSLARANGRVVATDIVATGDVPPFARAAMDGYAVRAEDTFGASRGEPRQLLVAERIYTGAVARHTVAAGRCAEIATGAPMPRGADAVVMVEETDPSGADGVRILSPVHPGQNVGRQGADIAAGATVLRAGDTLNPSRIGALAAVGVGEVTVYARPVVSLLATGDELVEPGQSLAPGKIFDVNSYTLQTLIAEQGAVPNVLRTAADTVEDLLRAIDERGASEAIVFSGGSSVGERDLVLDALQQRGRLLFHGIAVKPGKPMVFGLVDDTPFFGLPGYPASCLSNAYILLVPALRTLGRLPPLRRTTQRLPLARRVVSTTGRHQFYTVRVADGLAVPAFKASGDITSMSQADGYIEIPMHVDIVDEGELVDVTFF